MLTVSGRFRLPSVVHLALAAGLIAAVSLTTAGGASAAPDRSRQDAHRQAAALTLRMQRATEDYDAAREELLQSKARVVALSQQVEAQQRDVRALQGQVDDLAAAAYRGGTLRQLNAVFSVAGPQGWLDQLATLKNLSKTQRLQLEALDKAQWLLDIEREAISWEVAMQTQHEAMLLARKKAIEADLNKWRRLADAGNQQNRASRSSGRSAVLANYGPPPAATGRGGIALRFAYAQLGKPYSYGAAGPYSYDCSGLTMRAWQAAGISLPHSSRMQYGSSPHVARSQLRPGDLVFFFSPISHVGIFVGGDTIIGAPTTGDVVRYQRISSMPYAGATRPG